MTGWNLTRPNVTAWNSQTLTDLATIIEHVNGLFGYQMDRVPQHFSDLNGAWSGTAHDAAYDRVAEDHRQSQKIKTEVADTVTVIRDAGTRLFHERENVLAKAADAEDSAKAIAGETLKVGDNWQIEITFPAKVTDDDRGKIVERAEGHQGLINTAWTALRDAAHQIDRLILAAAQQVRDAGSNFGDAKDIAVTAGTADTRPELTADAGANDGKAIADGNASPEELAQITERLSQAGLTAEQLAAHARGEDITVPQSTMSYLQSFYDSAGRDGLVSLSDQLRSNGSPESLALNRNLANGLMTVSSEHVVTRNAQGGVQDRGGWEKLHPEIREFVGTRPQEGFVNAPDANTRLRPDDYRDGSDGRDRYYQDMSRFGALMDSADPGYEPGTRLGVEMSRQGAHLAYFTDNPDQATAMAPDGYWKPYINESAQDLLSAGARNSDSNYALITGNGSEELFGKGTPGQSFDGYNKDEFLSTVMRHEWPDNGAAQAKLYSWIEDDATSADIPTATRAGEAATALTNTLVKDYDTLMNMDGSRTASMGEVNPLAVQSLSSALSPYIPDLAGVQDNHLNTHGFTAPDGVNEHARPDAQKIFALMDTDREAAANFNAKALLASQELQSAWTNSVLDGKPAHELATKAGVLQQLVDVGLDKELADRDKDAVGKAVNAFADKGAAYDSAKAVLSTGVKYVPILGDIAGPAIDFNNTWAKNAIVGLYLPPEGGSENYDAHSNFEPARRLFQVAQVLETRDGQLDIDPQYSYLFGEDGKLKDYATLAGVEGRDETVLNSDLTNVLNGYRGGVLSTPLLQLDDLLENGRESVIPK